MSSDASVHAGVILRPGMTEAENWVVSPFAGTITRVSLDIRPAEGAEWDRDAYKFILDEILISLYLQGYLWLEGQACRFAVALPYYHLGATHWMTQKTVCEDRISVGDKVDFKLRWREDAATRDVLSKPWSIYAYLGVRT